MATPSPTPTIGSIDTLYRTALAQMDQHGFLPEHGCKQCGARLQGSGEDRPAERYLGTYTGLCYPCTNRMGFVERVCRDGAQLWSYPPSCPSHRRDREGAIGYADCPACGGTGRSRSTARCAACGKRYGADVRRAAYWRRSRQIGEAAQADCALAETQTRKIHRLRRGEDLPEDAWESIIAEITQRYRRALQHLYRWAAARDVWA